MIRGHTLLELTAVLTLAVIGAGLLAPGARGWRDRTAVLSARESVAALLTEARSIALTRGQSSVVLNARPWRAWTASGGSVIRRVELESALGVVVLLGRARDSTELSYGALGLGRFANETLEFRRGTARARLIVSGYGRLRRD